MLIAPQPTPLIMTAGFSGTAPAPTPSPSGIDPLTLSPIAAWDFSRSTMAVNSDGTGGTPAVGAQVYYLADLTLGSKHARRLAGNAPIRRTDAGTGRDYGEWEDTAAARLQSDAFARAAPFEIFYIVRARTGGAGSDAWKSDAYFGSSRDAYAAAVLQKGTSPNIAAYDGTDSPQTPMALSAWHVVHLISDATDSLQVDNATAVTGNFGANGISGGYNLGNGPDPDSARAGDLDLMAWYIMPQLTAPQRSGVKTFLGARVGLTL